MFNTITKMSGALAALISKKEEAKKQTKTRSTCYTSFTTTEAWADDGALHVPAVQLRNPDYAILLSAENSEKKTIVGIAMGAIETGIKSGEHTVELLNKTGAQIDSGATVHLMIVAQ
jgi:hypothetical protein